MHHNIRRAEIIPALRQAMLFLLLEWDVPANYFFLSSSNRERETTISATETEKCTYNKIPWKQEWWEFRPDRQSYFPFSRVEKDINQLLFNRMVPGWRNLTVLCFQSFAKDCHSIECALVTTIPSVFEVHHKMKRDFLLGNLFRCLKFMTVSLCIPAFSESAKKYNAINCTILMI